MKNDTQLNAKVLIVTVKELNKDSNYTFRVLEFENGLIAVEGHTTNDRYFEDRSCIEPNGNDIVTNIEDTGKIVHWRSSALLASIQGSIKEFGIDSVPKKHLQLWKKCK